MIDPIVKPLKCTMLCKDLCSTLKLCQECQSNLLRKKISFSYTLIRKLIFEPGTGACNPSYLGGQDWEDRGSRSAKANSSPK
jgi:hypothetical protein